MGMNLYGLKPASKAGKNFRSNIWYWEPLVKVCQAIAPEIAGRCNWDRPDGQGLGQTDAQALSDRLDQAWQSGLTPQVVRNNAEQVRNSSTNGELTYYFTRGRMKAGLDTSPQGPQGTEIPPELRDNMERAGFDVDQHMSEIQFYFTDSMHQEFISFLRQSGGFQIF